MPQFRLACPGPWTAQFPDSYSLVELRGYPEFFDTEEQALKALSESLGDDIADSKIFVVLVD